MTKSIGSGCNYWSIIEVISRYGHIAEQRPTSKPQCWGSASFVKLEKDWITSEWPTDIVRVAKWRTLDSRRQKISGDIKKEILSIQEQYSIVILQTSDMAFRRKSNWSLWCTHLFVYMYSILNKFNVSLKIFNYIEKIMPMFMSHVNHISFKWNIVNTSWIIGQITCHTQWGIKDRRMYNHSSWRQGV